MNYFGMVKIGITGSNNTGKSTLGYAITHALRSKGVRAELAQESVRDCPIGTKGQLTVEAQIWILGMQMQREQVLAHHEDVIICDKTSIDTFCYGQWAYKLNPSESNKNKLYVLEYLALHYAKTYDRLFLMPVSDEIHYRVWQEGVDHRREIDVLIREVLGKNNIPFTELKAPLNERPQELLSILYGENLIPGVKVAD